MGPAAFVDALAAVMLATSAYCAARLVAARAWNRTTHYDVDVGHVLMGVAMAGMLVSSLRTLPVWVWEVVFAGVTAWFAVQVVRFPIRYGVRGWDDDHLHHASHYVTHLAMAAAMLYMFLVGTPSPVMSMGGSGGTSSGATESGLPLVLAFILLVAAVWYADSLTRFTRGSRGGLRPAVNGADAGVLRSVAVGHLDRDAAESAPRLDVELTVEVAGPASSGNGHGWGEVLCSQDERWLAPRLEIATHIAMCVAMGYMLILMR